MTRLDPHQKSAGNSPAGQQHWSLPTMLEVVQWRAAQQPDQLAYTFLLDGEQQTAKYTCGQLDRRARAIAAELQRRGAAGRRALVVLEPGLDYVSALFGCFYAGVVAAPVYPPDPFRIARTLPRLQAIFGSAECELLLSSEEVLGGPESVLRQTCPRGSVAIETIPDDLAEDWRPARVDPDQLALLQYTSGTTGEPRGVPISHANLIHNLRGMERLLDVDDAVGLHWLPPYHDLGLIGGVFLPLFAGRHMVLMSPLNFMQRPARWLHAISRYRATSSAAPNFGYELCLRKISDRDCEGLDLSSWQVAVSGAEPVRADTLDRFYERFAPFGFQREAFVPAYGMAETTLMVSISPLGVAPSQREVCPDALAESRIESLSGGRRVVGCGPAGPGVEVRVVDPATRLETENVGEVWVRGPSVAKGYWRCPEQSEAHFNQSLANGVNGEASGFLRTGDLGFLDAGELYLVGRRKEMILLAGRNFYPQDIELALQEAHPAFKSDAGAATSVEFDNQERLVLFQEVQRPRKQDFEELLSIAQRVALEETGQQPLGVVLLPVGELPKTSSGKTRRSECRELHEAGALSVLAEWNAKDGLLRADNEPFEAPSGDTETWLARVWREVLGVERVGRSDNFFSLGGRSLQVTEMLAEVAERTGLTLPLKTMFDHPTLAGLAAHLGEQTPATLAEGGSPSAGIDLTQPQSLSASQQRFWMVEHFGVAGGANVPVGLLLEGRLAPERLAACLTTLIERHDALRCRFESAGAEVYQSASDFEKPTVDRWAAESTGDENLLESLLQSDWAAEPFDLGRAPLLRAGLVDCPNGQQALLLVAHHLVCDGGSIAVLLDELAALYAGEQLSSAPSFTDCLEAAPPPIDTADYWRQRLASAPVSIDLPLEPADAAPGLADLSATTLVVDPGLAASVDDLAAKLEATPFVLYLAAYQIVLSRYAGQSQIGVGAAVAGRRGAASRRAVGCFINTLPLFGELRNADRFDQFVRRLRDLTLADLDHAATPWEVIVEAAGKPRPSGRMPLVQAFFTHDDHPLSASTIGDARIVDAATDYRGLGVFDLSFVVETARPTPRFKLIHDGSRFPESLAENVLRSLASLLDTVCRVPQTELDRLPVPGPREANRLEAGGAEKKAPADEPKNVAAWFRKQAGRTATDTAVVCGEQSLSYAQLDSLSDQVARRLIRHNVRPGDRVGLMLTRSLHLPAVMLGVWKAGAAYVPLDPAYPRDRLALMAEDAELACLVADDELLDQAPASEGRIVGLTDLVDNDDEAPLELPLSGDALAYVMYTSGTTGKPKGVMVPHRAVANLLGSFARDTPLRPGDSMLGVTTFSFDISVLELCLPLVTGAKLVLADSSTAADANRLAELLSRQQVTHMQGAPSTYRSLLSTGWRPTSGQTLLCGGEEMPPDLAATLLESARELWNVYGPTETTIWSTIYKVEDVKGSIPIGKPIAATRCYIVDEKRRLAPIGAWGQLAIAGSGVADGYWNRPELTAERFPRDLCSQQPGQRMYLTGDTARWNAEGLLEFGGRSDGQVKVRGHRVELREIEIALCAHQTIGEAAVVPCGPCDNGATLVAYVTPANGHPWSPATLREHLAARLPGYMVPSAFVELASMPRTDNGKLDRKSLPRDAVANAVRSAPIVAPRSPLEAKLTQWVQELLRIEQVGVLDNFFEIGGQSLLATQLVVRMRDDLGVDPPLREVYERPTIAEWAEMILRLQFETGDQLSPALLDELDRMSDADAAEFLQGLQIGPSASGK